MQGGGGVTTLDLVLECFRDAHLAPSAIDRYLGLQDGRSHDLIVGWWMDQKREAKPKRDSKKRDAKAKRDGKGKRSGRG